MEDIRVTDNRKISGGYQGLPKIFPFYAKFQFTRIFFDSQKNSTISKSRPLFILFDSNSFGRYGTIRSIKNNTLLQKCKSVQIGSIESVVLRKKDSSNGRHFTKKTALTVGIFHLKKRQLNTDNLQSFYSKRRRDGNGQPYTVAYSFCDV